MAAVAEFRPHSNFKTYYEYLVSYEGYHFKYCWIPVKLFTYFSDHVLSVEMGNHDV